MRKMTTEEEVQAAALFAPDDVERPHKGEGNTHLSVRFDPANPGAVYWGYHARQRRIRMKDAVVLSFRIDPTATTPSGGKWVRQSVVVRTGDGKKWVGTVKAGTDKVILRRIPDQKR